MKRHGFDETSELGHRRATNVRMVTAGVCHKSVDAEGNTLGVPRYDRATEEQSTTR